MAVYTCKKCKINAFPVWSAYWEMKLRCFFWLYWMSRCFTGSGYYYVGTGAATNVYANKHKKRPDHLIDMLPLHSSHRKVLACVVCGRQKLCSKLLHGVEAWLMFIM